MHPGRQYSRSIPLHRNSRRGHRFLGDLPRRHRVRQQGQPHGDRLLGASDSLPSTVSNLFGCATGACTLYSGPTKLTGESIYGGIGRQNERFVTADLTTSEMEVYSYSSKTASARCSTISITGSPDAYLANRVLRGRHVLAERIK